MGKHLLPSKRSDNLKKYFKRVKECISQSQPKELNQKIIQRATNNLNSIASQKYGVSPNFFEENTQQDEKFCKIYDSYRLVKVKKYAVRYKHSNIRQDDKKRKKLRELLLLTKKFLYLLKG